MATFTKERVKHVVDILAPDSVGLVKGERDLFSDHNMLSIRSSD